LDTVSIRNYAAIIGFCFTGKGFDEGNTFIFIIF